MKIIPEYKNHMAFPSCLLMMCLFLYFLINTCPVFAENINDDFDLKAAFSREPLQIAITIAPKPDKQITGFAEDNPFITVAAEGIVFENPDGIFRTEYVTEKNPETFVFAIKQANSGKLPADIKLHVTMTYIPCIVSSGLCKFPVTIERDIVLKTGRDFISLPLLNTIILAGLFVLALAGLVSYIIFRKEIFFTGMFFLVCAGMLFYSFTDADASGSGSGSGNLSLSQADKALAIARTLCTSCIGLEIAVREKAPVVHPEKTAVYASLEHPVLITVFSAPWCGSCPAAKSYISDLCALYPDTLSYEVVDISLGTGIEKLKQFAGIYPLADPIPLPAVIVSTNTDEVIYGTNRLEENLLKLVMRKSNAVIPKL